MCMRIFPHPGGHVIASLEVGDEIAIKAGAGWPEAETDVNEVVINVDRASALTHTGRVLLCSDGFLIISTGVHYDDEGQYPSPVTDEARRLLAEAELRQAERDAEWQQAAADFERGDPLELL